MEDSISAMTTTVEMRQAQHVNYSVAMTSSIASEYDATVDGNHLTAAAAMVEAFWVHIRLLAEFLTQDLKGKDIGPADFGIAWDIPTSEEAMRLGEYWQIASKHVVHFGRPRVPHDLSELDVFEVSSQSFTRMVIDALTVYSIFMVHLRAAYPPVPTTEPVPNSQQHYAMWHERLLCDRSQVMTTAFLEACARVAIDGHSLLGE
jgi:hypothetical protein